MIAVKYRVRVLLGNVRWLMHRTCIAEVRLLARRSAGAVS